MKRKAVPRSRFEVEDQVQHLGLDREVEGRHGFVGHDQLRRGDQGARNGDSLPLPTRKLMRVTAGGIRSEPDRLENFVDAPDPLDASEPGNQRDAGVRPRCGRRSGAGRATRRGPGTPSAGRAGVAPGRGAEARTKARRRAAPARLSADPTPSRAAPASTSRSPDSPTMPRISPAAMLSETLSSARFCDPGRPPNRPPPP